MGLGLHQGLLSSWLRTSCSEILVDWHQLIGSLDELDALDLLDALDSLGSTEFA